ncbi:MAG: CHAT domain-containing protein [Anaerolineae bacterium]|jgi:ligand-binding sensor domain-containing protein|nr:CHAT domain-containing protein [Anaerolineae bacterium]MDH7473655.1 two-component regulator propeller domain-containing protein [Anaerolineae bacterium]
MAGVKISPRKYFLALLLLLFLLWPFGITAQGTRSGQPFRAVQNLDLTNVRAIGEDVNCLWFGTDDGLYCYNGHHASKSGSISEVRSILHDRAGTLWIGATDGVYRLDTGQTAPMRAFADVPGLTGVSAMLQTADGALWLGTARGMRRCDPASESCQEEIEADPRLRVDPDVTSLAEDEQGYIWLGTWGAGVYRFDLSRMAPVEGLADETIFAVARDSTGNLWFGTANGAFRRQPDGHLEQVVSDVPVLTIAEDAEHAIWLGTNDGVVRFFNGEMATFTAADGLVGQAVQVIWQDAKEGSLWFGTESGVSRFDGHFWRTFTTDDGLPQVTVRALAPADQDALWVGTASGVCCLQGNTCQAEEALTGLYVRDLWWDSASDELWIAAAGRGLLRYDGTTLHHELDDNVQALGQDAAGGMWLSTFSGVYRYTGLTPVEFQEMGIQPDESRVYAIFADHKGLLWFGTEGGLVRCSDEPRPLCDRRYLAERTVYAIAGDADGNLWLGTDVGVYPYVRGEDAVWDVPVFRATDGLADDVVFALLRDTAGDLWFGTDAGLTRYRPSKLAPRLEFAPAGIMRLTRSYHEAGLPVMLLGADFRVNPERLRYIYTLQSGQTPTHGFAVSDSLALPLRYRDVIGDNEYHLRVQALDPDLNISEEAVLDIVVKPRPFWQVPYIVVPGGLSLAAVLGVAVYVFVTSIAVEQRYRDVELVFSQDEVGVHIQACAEGVESAVATVSAAEVECLVERVIRPVLADLEEGRVGEDALRYLGRRLFETLFPPDVAALLDGHALRLRLRFEESARGLAALPWEYACGGQPPQFLGASPQTALVRDLSAGDGPSPEPHRVSRPLRVLVVASSPRDLVPLGLAAERRRLEEVWQPLVERGEMEWEFLERGDKSTMDALDSRLGAGEGWDIVHFIAHGKVDSSQAYLLLEDEDGWHEDVSEEQLSALFSGRLGPGRVRTPALVVLNACQTADLASAQATLGLAPVLVNRGQLLAVVGMQFPINDDAARLFAAKFYEALFRAGQVDYAIAKARNAIMSAKQGVEGRDWGSPVLYMQTREGRLFRFVGAEWSHVWRTARSRVLDFLRRRIRRGGETHE